MPATKVVIERISLVSDGPKNAFMISISDSSKGLIMNAQYAGKKSYRERVIDDFLSELGNPPEEVKDFFERMKEGGVREGVFSIEEGEFQLGGA